MRKNQAVIVFSVGILLFSVLAVVMQLVVLQHMPERSVTEYKVTAQASEVGYVRFCLNHAPNISNSCNTTMSQNQSYGCQLDISDVDNQNLTVSQEFLTNETFFNVSAGGAINTTPTNDEVGNHTVVFFVDDGLDCDNSVANVTVQFSVENVNDPPYLVENIPDQVFRSNTTLSAFFLTDFFADPDGDALTFTSTVPASITVTILPSSEVKFTSNACVSELVTFTATDPSNASADSNAVTIEVSCDTGGGSSGDDGEGGGGGGGGGNICESAWECDEWFDCLPSGLQWQRCYDTRGCEVERYLKRHCEYTGPPLACQENWLCGEWDACLPNATQYRVCEDLNECGSSVVRPAEVQSCIYAPTCEDGFKNGDEEGVDCGGSCPACGLIQKPTLISAGGWLSAWMLAIILITLLLTTAAARYYKAEIARAIAAIGFLLSHRVVKDVLLDATQRKMLFERILAFEQRERATVAQIYEDLAMLIRVYVREALGIPLEAQPEEIAARCAALKMHAHTRELVLGLSRKLEVLEQEELIADDLFVLATLEELRTLVCLTSEYAQAEILRPLEEVPISEEMSFYDEVFARMVNVFRAVQFDQVELAKKGYAELLSRYDPLSDADREAIYPELVWAFQATRLQSEVSGSRVIVKT